MLNFMITPILLGNNLSQCITNINGGMFKTIDLDNDNAMETSPDAHRFKK